MSGVHCIQDSKVYSLRNGFSYNKVKNVCDIVENILRSN